MNDIIAQVKEKYPIYKDSDPDSLTMQIATKYPIYLKNESFKQDYGRIVSEGYSKSTALPELAPKTESTLDQETKIRLTQFQPIPGEEKPAQLPIDVFSPGAINLPRFDAQGKSWPMQVAAGVGNFALDIAEFMGSPEGLSTFLVPQAAIPAVITTMFAQMPEMAVQAGKALGQKDYQSATTSILGYLATPVAAKAIEVAKQAKPVEQPNLAPKTEAAVQETIAATEQKPPVIEQPKPIEKPAEIQAIAETPVVIEKPVEPQPEPQPIQPELPQEPKTENLAAIPKGLATAPPAELMETATPKSPGIAANVRSKWANATRQPLGGSEAGFITLAPIKELYDRASESVREAVDSIMAVGREAKSGITEAVKSEAKLEPVTDYRKAIFNWSARLQQSFGEASEAQKEIISKVRDPIRREAISNWIQADGDKQVLADRAARSKTARLRRGYEAAMNLTPEELAVANEVKLTFEELADRGKHYDVLEHLRDNYVPQVWNLGQGPSGGFGGKTLRQQFRFSKARSFESYFEGEQAGFVPKTKDIAKIMPLYVHEMNTVIAARQLVQDMQNGFASDGLPLIQPKGAGIPVDGPQGKATLVIPQITKGKSAKEVRYQTLPNQPALSDWIWASKDSAGKPVFLKAELALHPEAYNKLKNVLGQSAIREWYRTPTTALGEIPKAIARGIDMAQSETKRTMLGLLATFHQVQEGTHAVGHRVNPFYSIPKIDLVNNAGQLDAARHGLMMLPDRASANQFMEGFRHSGLISKIPALGPMADWYSSYLFQEYIPGLKYKTYEAIRERNTKLYASELASGKVTIGDVKALSATQSNAAFGHLNYADVVRNPTLQHIAQLLTLAPDFWEARARFAGEAIKGITGAKVGREQLLALGTLAICQATGAFVLSKMTGGEWDLKDPFSFHVGNRKYTLRSVPEDAVNAKKDWRSYVYSRLNPLVGRGIVQYLSGVDWRGKPVKAAETTKELAMQPLPLTLRALLGTANSPLRPLEQLAASAGIKISRYSPSVDVWQMVADFKKNSPDPKIREQQEREEASTYPESVYKPLRTAIENGDTEQAKKAYVKLLETRSAKEITKGMEGASKRPFISKALEPDFISSLKPDQKKTYNEAVKEKQKLFSEYLALFPENRKYTKP